MSIDIKRMARFCQVALVVVLLAGCSSWKSSDSAELTTTQSRVEITTGDINTHEYETLGEISASAVRDGWFQSNPSREKVDAELKRKAAAVGADAVIFVRYDFDDDGVPYERYDARGKAVKFVD